MFIATLSIIAKTENNLSPGEWINELCISIQWNTIQQQKEELLIQKENRDNLQCIKLNERIKIPKATSCGGPEKRAKLYMDGEQISDCQGFDTGESPDYKRAA